MDGLEIKVRLGAVWKQSLTELSGGQRYVEQLVLMRGAYSLVTLADRSSPSRSSWRCCSIRPRLSTFSTRSTPHSICRTRRTSALSSARVSRARSSSSYPSRRVCSPMQMCSSRRASATGPVSLSVLRTGLVVRAGDDEGWLILVFILIMCLLMLSFAFACILVLLSHCIVVIYPTSFSHSQQASESELDVSK